jgi:hypothetical protein
MIGTVIGLAYHYLEESAAAALLEVFKMANALEELIGEGILRGRQEGREVGRAEGALEGKRASLRLVVRTRFGDVPEPLDARIESSDTAALDGLLTRALTVERADQI